MGTFNEYFDYYILCVFFTVYFWRAAIRDFSTTLLLGLISGTYSSIYIASPLLVLLKGETIQREFEKKEGVVQVVHEVNDTEVEETPEVEEVKPVPQVRKSHKKVKRVVRRGNKYNINILLGGRNGP